MSALRGSVGVKMFQISKHQFYEEGAAQHFPKVFEIENAQSKWVSSISWTKKIMKPPLCFLINIHYDSMYYVAAISSVGVLKTIMKT